MKGEGSMRLTLSLIALALAMFGADFGLDGFTWDE